MENLFEQSVFELFILAIATTLGIFCFIGLEMFCEWLFKRRTTWPRI